MRRIFRWAGVAAGVLFAVFLTGLTVLYAGSEVVMARRYDRPATTLVAASGVDAIARGERMAAVYGCRDCHADNLQGSLFHDEPMLARIRAPNLTRVAQTWSDAEIDGALRHGVRRDGRALWVMPSAAFSRMSDADAADVVAYLRSRPAAGRELPRSTLGPMGRLGVLLGKFQSEPEAIKAGPAVPADLGPEHARGRYLAMVACGECHGPALRGGSGVLKTPDLTIAASYDRDAFARFMRTGVAADGKQRRMMSGIARARFSRLTDQEIGQIHAYLSARAERAP